MILILYFENFLFKLFYQINYSFKSIYIYKTFILSPLLSSFSKFNSIIIFNYLSTLLYILHHLNTKFKIYYKNFDFLNLFNIL